MAVKGSTNQNKKSESTDRSHELRHQELQKSRTVTGAGETSHDGTESWGDRDEDDFGANGNDVAALGMEDIGGTDTEMLEERVNDMER